LLVGKSFWRDILLEREIDKNPSHRTVGETVTPIIAKKERADKIIVSRGLAESRQQAQALIMAGLVFAEGQRVEKPGQRIDNDQDLLIKERMPYVSRGGLKLAEALDIFSLSVEGKTAADLGASTGGFTDCLLQRGASRVYAVDVDIRQIDWRLREDNRVILIEKNARYLNREDFGEELDIVAADLSFISVLKVLPAVKEFLSQGKLLSLLKPQFEVGKGQVGKKGIVRDRRLHEEVLDRITGKADQMGFKVEDLMRSSIRGSKGNIEFFVLWSLQGKSLSQRRVKRIIKEAVWNEKN
jgi:23S rRNA (cytidine1920-2'-O)/16S rRNA (cytidine1409-2'-O)-methyltransferase